MAQNTVYNINKTFPIYHDVNGVKTPFHDLVMKKSTVESVVMSLGDKISGDVYYPNNNLPFTMQEYVEFDGVRYYLVSPPTIVREGLVKDNSGLNGMTKYSLVFYHPMYMLGNFPFTDIAVTQDEQKYLSQNKTFSWIGTLFDFIAKLNANLQSTEWLVVSNIASGTTDYDKASELSEVMSFDKQFISDALKDAYEQWEIPFVIDQIHEGGYYDSDTHTAEHDYYNLGKRFVVQFGLPTQEILDSNNQPFVFQYGQGVGLKNNSRTPRNNKIVTRIVPYGAERNIPYGYPQIPWYGDSRWEYTEYQGEVVYGDDNKPINQPAAGAYPIYDGIVAGQPTKLIKHPFTRTTLMPSVYGQCVFNKVSRYVEGGGINPNYNPNEVIVDYYDATAAENYPNPINPSSPSVEIHQFEEVYPRLGNATILGATPIDATTSSGKVIITPTISTFTSTTLAAAKAASSIELEKDAIQRLIDWLTTYANAGATIAYYDSANGGAYTFSCAAQPMTASKPHHWLINYTSGTFNLLNVEVVETAYASTVQWDDTMDDDGNYAQSYFEITLPQLSFDLYACASVTEQMDINMRDGACIGCTFPVQVDWDDYKKNFYRADGTFDPAMHTQQDDGHVRDASKYPDSSQGSITVIVKKETETFGTLMPNIYQQPKSGDPFVILGISLPTSYTTNAEHELDSESKEYMLENNVYYFDYPLKFDEAFLTTHDSILAQIHNNTIVRFAYPVGGSTLALYVKQMSIKYGENVLPQYDITLTDDVEVVLNQIGQVTDNVSRMQVQLSELQRYYTGDLLKSIEEKLSRVFDDVAQGRITFQKGLDAIGSAIFSEEVKSSDFEQGLYGGRGWRIDQLGNAEFESVRVRSYLEIVELLVNRMRAQEGDTLFTDNDQIDKVEQSQSDPTQYILSFKQKYDGYVTSQKYGNILRGVINTLAAKQAGVSDETLHPQGQESDEGGNKYYTSWMQVIGTHSTIGTLGINQVLVTLYGDSDIPQDHNFPPCELMTVARWGCVLNPNEQGISEAEKLDRIRRQTVFAISTSDGRIVKYEGVSYPILDKYNYGVSIGELPDDIKRYPSVAEVLERVGEHTNWLYAQGIVVNKFVKIGSDGRPETQFIDCGQWVNGSTIENPTPRNGVYLVNQWNETTQQYETHDVWHEGHRWRCMIPQPVVSGGVTTYNEPKWNSSYWVMIEGNDNYSLEFESSNGYSFRRNAVDTYITPHLFYGNTEITRDISDLQYWNWERESEQEPHKTTEDLRWDAEHKGARLQEIVLHLTNNDMPASWASNNKAIFTCKVSIINGDETVIIENQIIS